MLTPQDLISSLVLEIPQLDTTLAEHLEDNFGELLPHVFMGDVTRYAEELDPAGIELAQILALLDDYHRRGDKATKELLEVSFIENLGYKSPLIKRLGPSLGSTDIARSLRG